jgi:hypothetical protein
MRIALPFSMLLILIAPISAFAQPATQAERKLNPTLLQADPNVWFKLHEQKPGDMVCFGRQEHGGSCFDSKRGRLILFGSNSHGKDWHNSPRFFDPVASQWTQAYPDDKFETYAVTEAGLPVAGEKGDHPWVTHTFGSLEYDASRDEVVPVIYDSHLVPGRFTNVFKDLWPKVKVFPNWTYDCGKNVWRPLPCKPQHFFPTCATYDSDRKSILGYRGDGIWELAGEPREWKQVTKKVFLGGYHNNAVYDSKNKAMVIFGMNANTNDIEAFWPDSGEHKLMSTAGDRPAKDQHAPMAFHARLGQTVVVVDRNLTPEEKNKPKLQAETWLYDLGKDAWTPVKPATLPFGCGMNYNMEYDPAHDCLLLVTGSGWGGAVTTVWALRIDEKKLAN